MGCNDTYTMWCTYLKCVSIKQYQCIKGAIHAGPLHAGPLPGAMGLELEKYLVIWD